jgi:hypothetical protein
LPSHELSSVDDIPGTPYGLDLQTVHEQRASNCAVRTGATVVLARSDYQSGRSTAPPVAGWRWPAHQT